jgi:hypothetical protein
MRMLFVAFTAVFVVGISLAAASPGAAQEPDTITPDADAQQQLEPEESWLREQQGFKQNSRAIIFEKAQVRAYQRNSRMASMNWYGMSGPRPMSSATPFMSRYGSVWEMPGGRPYSWYPQSRPGYVLYWR